MVMAVICTAYQGHFISLVLSLSLYILVFKNFFVVVFGTAFLPS